MKVIYVDIDETICNRESSTDLEQLTITPKQNQFKIILIRLTNCMTKEIQLYIGQQEEVENRLID